MLGWHFPLDTAPYPQSDCREMQVIPVKLTGFFQHGDRALAVAMLEERQAIFEGGFCFFHPVEHSSSQGQ